MSSPVRIIIADEHSLYRTGIKTVLSNKSDIKIVGEVDTGIALTEMLKGLEDVDIILLSNTLPRVLGNYNTLLGLKKAYPALKVIVLMESSVSLETVKKAMHDGADTCLLRKEPAGNIHKTILSVNTGKFYLNDLTTKAAISLIRNTPSGRSQTFITATLSDKEKSILTLMCEEKTTQEIAGIMEISPRTVESIREKLKEKTGAKSMVGLALYAVASDIVESKELV